MKELEGVDEFAAKVDKIVSSMHTLGDNVGGFKAEMVVACGVRRQFGLVGTVNRQ